MSTAPACPQCTLENTYPDGSNFVCADCGFEWPQSENAGEEEGERIVKDANGNVLVSVAHRTTLEVYHDKQLNLMAPGNNRVSA